MCVLLKKKNDHFLILMEQTFTLSFDGATKAVVPPATPRLIHVPLPDRQFYDEIHIRTEPRYKMSSMSGNEWRFCAVVEFRYKGRTFHTFNAGNVREAMHELPYVIRENAFIDAADKLDTADLCDQEGCSQPWTKIFKMKVRHACVCGQESYAASNAYSSAVRRFCAEHATRGNSPYEDGDRNYVDITPAKEETRDAVLM